MATGWRKDYFRYKELFLNILYVYNSKPNLKIYLELVLSLTTIVIFSLFAIRPTILTIIELNNEIKSKEAVILKLKNKLTNLETASNLLQSNQSSIEMVNQAVPDNAKPQDFLSQIENLALGNSLIVSNISLTDVLMFGKTTSKEKVNELPFTISVSGTYQNIYDFLTKMENLKKPVKIESLAINSNVTESGKVLVLIISGKVPFLVN